MNMEVSRRRFYEGRRRRRRRHGARGTRLRRGRGGVCRGDPPVQARQYRRNPQHLSLLRGRLRHHHVFEGRPEEGRDGRDRPHRRRRGSPDQPRHAVPEGRGAARFRPCPDAAQISDDPQARLRQVRARILGRRARPRRAADEGRPRQEFHRQEQRRRHRQPLAHHRLSRRVGDDQRNGVGDLQGGAQRRDVWHSTIRRASDTAPRWPVWPQHSAVAR